jgi:hypothetical protein
MSDNTNHETQDHKTIRSWAEERDGHPAKVENTGNDQLPLIKISFGQDNEKLDPISWDQFFEAFDANNLKFIYQNENNDGDKSNFNKIISA